MHLPLRVYVCLSVSIVNNSKTQKMSTEKSYTAAENRPMTIIAVEFWLNLGVTHD